MTSAALLHPVRMRVVQALLAGDGLTTHELHERLPDIPIATLYRHVAYLVTHGLLRPGARVLVVGAAGNVGGAVVAMATAMGAEVFATASARDLDYCRALGAASVSDYRDPTWPTAVDLYVDCAGVNDLATAVGLLAPRGRIVLLAGAATRPVLPVGPLYTNDCSIAGFVISHATADELAAAATTINRLLTDGVLRPRAVEELPLDAAAHTHERMERGELHGRRVVLRP